MDSRSNDEKPVAPQPPYKFTAEEYRVLRQCNRESFYKRSLPLAATFGIGAFYAIKRGYLRSSQRLGPAPKVTLAAAIGYFIGKVSYQRECLSRIMELPNSPLGELLRQRNGLTTSSETPPEQQDLWNELYTTDQVSQVEPAKNGPDSYRELESLYDRDVIHEGPSQATSYESLRAKNRSEFAVKNSKTQRDPDFQSNVRTPDSGLADREAAGVFKAKNKYGDVWDD